MASFFYQLYKKEGSKNNLVNQQIYDCFGIESLRKLTIINLYIKILYALSKVDLKKETLITDFIKVYGECFPEEREEIIKIFTKVTHFSTIDYKSKELFGNMYRVGHRGNIDKVKKELDNLNRIKNDLITRILRGVLYGFETGSYGGFTTN